MKAILNFSLFLFLPSLLLSQPFGVQQNLMNQIDRPSDIEVLDFDKDGDIDLLVANALSNYILLYENVGNRQFIERQINQNSNVIYENIEVADMDNDGNYELIAASYRNKVITLFQMQGKTVIEQVTLDEGIESSSMIVGDYDQDGYSDIVYSINENNGAAIILWNEGALNFKTDTASVEIGQNALLFATDINKDSNLDIISYSTNIGRTFSILNEGDKKFEKFDAARASSNIVNGCIGDINQDGFIDLVPSYDSDNLIAFRYFLNDENNGFLRRGFTNISPKAACLIDVDFDDIKEIMIFDADGLTLSFKYIDGFDFERDTIESITDTYDFMKVFDFNEDGIDDFVGVNRGNSEIALHLQKPDTTFEKILIATNTGIYQPNGLKSLDINNDGIQELIGYSEYTRSAVVWEKSPNGLLAGKAILNLPVDGGLLNGFTDLEPFDLDNDGQLDIVAATLVDDESLSWFKKIGENEYSYNPIEVPFHAITGIDIIDLNNDGKADIPCVSRGENRIGILIDTGNISYEYQSLSNSYDRPTDIEAVDIDLDGDADLICKYGSVGGQMVIFENTGNSFTAKESLNGLILVDIDKDGDIDVVGGRNSNNITCHYNDGSGNFTAEIIASTGSHENDELYASDIDNDGDIDIISGESNVTSQSTIVYVLNNGDGTYANYQTMESNVSVISKIFAEDFDADGDQEVIVAAVNRGDISWFENLAVNCSANGTTRVIDACDQYVLNDGTVINESDIFTDTLYNAYGCDSVITFDIQIFRIDSTVILNENTIEVINTNGVTFQWISCDDNYAPILGETSNLFEADSTGNYAVILTKQGCVDTSECIYVQLTSTNEVGERINIETFPNPVKDVLNIRGLPVGGNIIIQDINGKIMSTYDVITPQMDLSIASFQAGVYFLKVTAKEKDQKVLTFIKQ